MRFGKTFKDFIKAADFFYSNQMFRYQDQLQYKTLTGGCLSLAIIITICIAFFSMVLQTINRNVFITSLQVNKNADPQLAILSTKPESYFMFGVQIWGLNLSDTRRYFDISFYSMTQNNTEIPLQTCTEKHWQKFPQLLEQYDIGSWLCPPLNFEFKIKGKYSSKQYFSHNIYVSACYNQTVTSNSTRYSSVEIEDLFYRNRNSLGFSVYYSTPIINQDKKQYKSYYVEDQSYTFFGPGLGSQNYLYFTDYSIQTDESIFPFEQMKSESGLLVEQVPRKYPFQTQPDGYFVVFYFVKSSSSFAYKRVVQKLSAVFSFIGGNIAALSGVLFIIKMYTEFAFSINLAYNLFQRQQGQGPSNSQTNHSNEININFLQYFKFAVYKLCTIFGRQRPEWQQAKYIQKCQKEIDKQLDLKLLLQRLIFLQFCITYMFEDFQLEGLQQKKPKTSEQIKKTRQKSLSVASNEEIQSTIKGSKRIIDKQQHKKDKDNDNKDHIQLKTVDMQADTNKQCIPQKRKLEPNYKEMMAVESISGQKVEESSVNFDNKIMDICVVEQRKRNLLVKLRKQAQRGDHLSVKIWKKFTQHQIEDLSLNQE